MTITARYPGKCTVCGRSIRAGEQIEWDKASRTTAHARCAGGKATTAAPVANVPQGRNRRPGSCERCGCNLAVGAGRLEYCIEDSGCMVHHDESGYHLYCVDEAPCKVRATEARKAAAEARAQAQAEAAAKAEAEKAQAEAANAEFERLTAGLTCAGGNYIMPAATDQGEVLLRWQDGWWSRVLTRYTLESGAVMFVASASGHDDYRRTIYAHRPVVENAWLAWATQHNVTREQAVDFLTRYAGCYGHEAYEFIAAMPPAISGGSQQWTRQDIMVRAHEIARTCEGDYAARMALGLRQAWSEARQVVAA